MPAHINIQFNSPSFWFLKAVADAHAAVLKKHGHQNGVWDSHRMELKICLHL
jgi:hypothetical protein